MTFKVFGDVDEFDEIVFRGRLEDGKAIGFYLSGGRFVAALLVGQEMRGGERLEGALATQTIPHRGLGKPSSSKTTSRRAPREDSLGR